MRLLTALRVLWWIPVFIQITITIGIIMGWIIIQKQLWPGGSPEQNYWVLAPIGVWGVQFVYFLMVLGVIPLTKSTEPETS